MSEKFTPVTEIKPGDMIPLGEYDGPWSKVTAVETKDDVTKLITEADTIYVESNTILPMRRDQ